MSDIVKKENSSMMMLAQAIGGLNVMEPPEIPNNQSWLPRKFTKSKVRDINEMSDMMAGTLENNTRALQAKLNGAVAMMTASDRLKLEFKKIEHEEKMMVYAQIRGQKDIDMADAQIDRVKEETARIREETARIREETERIKVEKLLVQVKVESALQDLSTQKLEDKLKELSITKRIENGDY